MLCSAIVMLAGIFGPVPSGWAQSPAAKPPPEAGAVRDALAVQQARSAHGASTSPDARFYTKDWDLSALPRYAPEQPVTGTIRVWGNDVLTRGRLLHYLEEGFHRFQRGVSLSFHLKSSAAALPALLTGVADIGIGRHIMFMEQLGFQRTFGYDPLEIEALNGAYDVLGWNPAWVIVVNKNNPLTRLTVQQLDGIFGAERNGGWVGTTWHPEFARGAEDNIRSWGQLGLTGPWKDQPIKVLSMPLQYDPAATFCRLVIKGSDKWNERLRQYPQYANPDGSLSVGAQRLVQDIGQDPYAIGWSALGYLTPQTKALAVAASEAGPNIAPNIESVQDRSYYFHNTNYFYINRKPGQPVDPKVKEFLRYILSREGQEAVMRDGKLLPMPAAAVRAELEKLK
jgi:phosphate transport system substrate-binding protein